MAGNAEDYARWIVENPHLKGTPEFETVVQAYRQARQPAQVAATQQAGENAIAAEPRSPYFTNIVGQVAQGATMGFADEMLGSRASEARAEQERFKTKYPVASTAAELVGGALILGPLGVGARALGGAIPAASRAIAAIPTMARGTAASAAAGAAYGAGASAPGERLQGAMGGGVAGAALGAAGETGSRAVRSATETATSFISPQRYLGRKLGEAAANDLTTPSELVARAQAMGPGTPFAEVGGENLRALALRAAGTPGPDRTLLLQQLRARSSSLVDEVRGSLNRAFGPDDFFAEREDLARRLGTEATPLYDAAYAANPSIMTPEIRRVLDAPAGRDALRKAAVAMQNEFARVGRPDPELTQALNEAVALGLAEPSKGGVAAGLTLRTLDYVKRVLDSEVVDIRNAIAKGNRSESYKLTGLENLRNTLVRSLDDTDVTGTYAQARQLWSGTKATLDALDAGKGFLRLAPQEIGAVLNDMSEAERRAFRIGAGRSLADLVEKGGEGKLAKNEYIGRQIEAALPPQDFEEVVRATYRAGSARALTQDVERAYGQDIKQDPRLVRAVGRLGGLAGAAVPGTHALLGFAMGRQAAESALPAVQTGNLARALLGDATTGASLMSLGGGRGQAFARLPPISIRPSALGALAGAQQFGLAQAPSPLSDEELRRRAMAATLAGVR